ncbi:MAG: alpha-1,2-fucosyltransferase [Paludibacteraceae bacterium]
MIIASLFGGLGNQLFQYANARAVSLRLGVELQLDTSIIRGKEEVADFTNRDFELSVFNINAGISDVKEVRKYVPNLLRTPKWFHQIYRIKRMFTGKHLFIERTWNRFHYIPSIERVKDNTYLYGYFQTERFFKDIRAEILDAIQLKPDISVSTENQTIFNSMKNENAVSIHVRRGDYQNSNFMLLEMDYYAKAIERISETVKNPKFYIFSNDMDWVRHQFSNLNIDFQAIDINTGEQSYMDMILMSNCKHNIIANSTFSWWGAWLNTHEDKVVIAPKNWFKQKDKSSELIPDEWIKI